MSWVTRLWARCHKPRASRRERVQALVDRIEQSPRRLLVQDLGNPAGGAFASLGCSNPIEVMSLGRLAQLTPFSPVAISLLRLFDRDDVEPGEIARLAASDAVLESEVLCLANSARFGLSGRVVSPAHAIAMLGPLTVKGLASILAMRSLVAGAPRTPVMRRVWRHSVATSVIAGNLAPVYGLAAGLADTTAMMHDLGRIALMSAYREEYKAIAVRSHDSVEATLEAEHSACGMNHCEAGLLLSRAWNLPDIFHGVVARHHEISCRRDLVSLIQLSCALADDLNFDGIHHADQCGVAETVEAEVPEQLRGGIMRLLVGIDLKVLNRLESLDF